MIKSKSATKTCLCYFVSLKEMFCVSPGIWDSLQTSLQGTCRVKTGAEDDRSTYRSTAFYGLLNCFIFNSSAAFFCFSTTLLESPSLELPPGYQSRRSNLALPTSKLEDSKKIHFDPPPKLSKTKKGYNISILGKKIKHSKIVHDVCFWCKN